MHDTFRALNEHFVFPLKIKGVSHTYLNALRLRHFSPEEHTAGRVLNSHRSRHKNVHKIKVKRMSRESSPQQISSLLIYNNYHSHTTLQCSLEIVRLGKDTKLNEVPKALQPLLRLRVDSIALKFGVHWGAFLQSIRGKGILGISWKMISMNVLSP